MNLPDPPPLNARCRTLTRALRACLIAPLACWGLSCERERPPAPETPAPAVSRVAEGDGVQMLVTLDRELVPTSELLTLRIHATFQPGLVLSSPELSGHNELSISETIRTPPRRRTDRAVEQSWTVTLEPNLPGPALAPGVKLTVRDTRTGSLAYIASEPIAVEVASVLDAGEGTEVTELRAVPSPAPEGETIWDTLRALVGGATFATIFLIGLGVLVVLLITRRLRPSSITHARRRIDTLVEGVNKMHDHERLAALSEASRLLRSAIVERASLPALAMTDVELLSACPQLRHVGDLEALMPEIETALCSGMTPDARATRSILVRSERALDELSTFVPTRYLTSEEVPA